MVQTTSESPLWLNLTVNLNMLLLCESQIPSCQYIWLSNNSNQWLCNYNNNVLHSLSLLCRCGCWSPPASSSWRVEAEDPLSPPPLSLCWPALPALKTNHSEHQNTDLTQKKLDWVKLSVVLCCPCCIVTKNGCAIPPVVCRLPCWSVTMVITLWPPSLTTAACWMLESRALAAIASSESPETWTWRD